MSIGNLKDSGNQGNNFPWQFKMLKGLQTLADLLVGINGWINVISTNINPQLRIPNIERASGTAGAISAVTYSASFANVGTANALVLGKTLKPGEIINYSADALNNTFNKNIFTYDTTTAGAELIITYITA